MTDNYGDVAGYTAYALARNWPATTVPSVDAVTLAALLVASEALDQRYRAAFSGYKTGQRAQIREWPRTGAYALAGSGQPAMYGNEYWPYGYPIFPNEIPVEVPNATYEMARREIAVPGSLSKDFTMGNTFKQVSVVGAVSVTFAGVTGVQDAQLIIPVVDGILAPLLTGMGNSSGLSGKLARV